MQFRIKHTQIYISFTFLALLILFLSIGELNFCILSLSASLIHEFIHLFFIILFSGKISKINLSLFGADIVRHTQHSLTNVKEAVISFSAPVMNILIGIIIFWLNGFFTRFSVVNLTIGVFNILPFFNFDGGRGLKYLLSCRLSERVCDYIIIFLSVGVTIIFSFLSVYIFFNSSKNFILIFLSIYMIFSIIMSVRKKTKIKS